MISTHLDLYKNVHSDIDIYHLKERKTQTFKINIFVELFG
jgi:hypothetical protein